MEIKEAVNYLNDVLSGMELGQRLTGVPLEPVAMKMGEAIIAVLAELQNLEKENGALKLGMTMDHIQAMEELKNNKKQ